jgi:hypothetical protein
MELVIVMIVGMVIGATIHHGMTCKDPYKESEIDEKSKIIISKEEMCSFYKTPRQKPSDS